MKKFIFFLITGCLNFYAIAVNSAPIIGCVESSSYPIKVCYEDEADISLAQEILPSAERVWSIFIEQIGFSEPWRTGENGNPERGVEVVLTDLGEEVSGYSEPVSDIPQTLESDCTSRLYINKSIPSYYSRMVISHEMGHMILMAQDCVEAFGEGFPTYATILYVKLSGGIPVENFLEWTADMFFENFQSHPYFAIDYENNAEQDLLYYAFGQSLFYMYLDEKWGNGRGEILPEILEHSKQNGTVVISGGIPSLESGENEPDLFDAINEVLEPMGGSFWGAIKEFSVWRYFTGELADDKHFQYAASLPPVAIDSRFETAQLPVAGMRPAYGPAETGTTYFEVGIDRSVIESEEDSLVLDISSTESANWYIAALTFNTDGTHTFNEFSSDNAAVYAAASSLSNALKVTFAITNMGDMVHDPDNHEFSTSNFEFSIHLYKKPVLTGLSPQQVTQGDENVEINITGAGFTDGINIDFGEGVTVLDMVISGSGDTIETKVNVSPDAPTGWHKLRLFYPHGPETSIDQGIEVLSGQGPEITGIEPQKGNQGDKMNVEISGTRFRRGAKVSFSGNGITVLRTDFLDENTIIASVHISPSAEIGKRNILVTNPDSKSFTAEDIFTIEQSKEFITPHEEEISGGCSCNIAGNEKTENVNEKGFGVIFLLMILMTTGFFISIRKLSLSPYRSIKKFILFVSGSIFLLIVFLTISASAETSSNADNQEIEKKVQRILDLLSPATSIAAKAPSSKKLSKCGTQNRVEAFRLWHSLPEKQKKDLGPLFDPPAPLGCFESTIYPIRSCYNTESQIPQAQAILGYAETSWRILIDEVGFWPPKRGNFSSPETGIDFYLGDTISMGAEAYTSPTGYDETSDHISCLSYIVINENMSPMDYYVTVVGHELDHGCQVSMDCTETFNSMESTSTWTEPILYPGSYYSFVYVLPEFQGYPERSVGYWNYNDTYMYGAALFIFYVEEFLGGKEPSSIARVWEGTVQSTMNNEPDLLDSIISLAGTQSIDFTTVFSNFGEWRYFVGSMDDGNHFEHGGGWRGGEVKINGTLDLSSPSRFPISISKDIQPLGYLFERVQSNFSSFPKGRLVITGQGSSNSSWDMELWFMKDRTIDKKEYAISDETGAAHLELESTELENSEEFVFMVLNLGKDVDWDQNWREQHFTASFDYLTYPVIDSVSPERVYLGEQRTLTISGSNFSPDFEVRIEGEGIEINRKSLGNDGKIYCDITVSADAPAGRRDITVINYPQYEGIYDTMEDAIEVTLPYTPCAVALDPDYGYAGQNPIVRMEGRDLTPDITLKFSCPEIEITRTKFIDSQTMFLYLKISPQSQEKTCDLEITDRFERNSSLPRAFSIISDIPDAQAEEQTEIKFNGGSCGCSIIM